MWNGGPVGWSQLIRAPGTPEGSAPWCIREMLLRPYVVDNVEQ